MSKPLTNTKTPNPSNPSALEDRYEIRKLDVSHIPWVSAIISHSNGFHSTVWTQIPLYNADMGGLVRKLTSEAEYLVRHQIESGHSYGVFDTEYVFKREESKATGGKLYWDDSATSIQPQQGLAAEGERMLQQMDFSLVSIALSYDSFMPLDMQQMSSMVATLPHYGLIFKLLGERDQRDPASWQATGPGQVLFRNATSTRHDYEGQGIVSGMARWLMREASQQGFRGIQIESLADAVTHIWSKAEPPFKGQVVSEFDTDWADENGDNSFILCKAGEKPFAPAKQRITKCYVDLSPQA